MLGHGVLEAAIVARLRQIVVLLFTLLGAATHKVVQLLVCHCAQQQVETVHVASLLFLWHHLEQRVCVSFHSALVGSAWTWCFTRVRDGHRAARVASAHNTRL